VSPEPVSPESTSYRDADLLALALETAREAGRLVVGMREQGVDVAGTKSSPIDVVTEADQASEELIRQRLLGARPDDGFLGEEGDDIAGTSGIQWIVDPIDGTVNYLYGLPHYAVSIAAARGDEIVAAVVLSPVTAVEYAATLGAGATRNGEPIEVRRPSPLDQSLIGTGFGYETEVRARQAQAVARMLPRVRDIRRIGSCALDLCAVASGQLDGYVEEGPHIWDYAAGGLIAIEAGASLEIWTSVVDHDLVVCAPALGWSEFSDLVLACDFLGARSA
jgi:myo-inositol-1(or 4)-monophosphatase